MAPRIRLVVLSLPLILIHVTIFSQECIQWRTFAQAAEEVQSQGKKMMVEVSIRSCGWCKVMEKTTLSDPEVVQYVNHYYIPVKLNAEETEPLEFKGRTYRIREQGQRSYHELAIEIMRGRLSFPTIVFLDEQQNVIQPIPGFHEAEPFLMVLRYFGENHYQRIPWDKYNQTFNQGKRLGQPVRRNSR